jgi:hypothetical protein
MDATGRRRGEAALKMALLSAMRENQSRALAAPPADSSMSEGSSSTWPIPLPRMPAPVHVRRLRAMTAARGAGATVPGVRGCKSGKVGFATEEQARTRLRQLLAVEASSRGYWPVGVHWCGRCEMWHLTSKSQKAWKHGKRRPARGSSEDR